MRRVLGRIFNVQAGEGPTVLILLAFIFFIQSVLSTGKVLQYAIFLDGFGKKSLALAFILAPVVLAVVSAFYSALTRLVPGRILVPSTLVVLAGGFVFWRLVFGPEPPPFPIPDVWQPEAVPPPTGPFFLYIWVEVASSIAIVQAWSYVSDVFDPRQAKRLIPLVGLGASLSFLLNGFVVNPLVKHVINAEELTWLVVTSLLAAIAMLHLASKRGLGLDRPKGQRSHGRGKKTDSFFGAMSTGFHQIASTPLLRLFAIITVATIITQGLLDYLFMNELRARFDKNALASFYAMFFALLGGLQVVFQMFLSGRLLTRLGSVVCLTIAPAAVALAGLAYVALPIFWLLVSLRFGDRLLKQAFYSPSLQALYTPVPTVAKRQAMTLIKGVISPLSFAVFGLLLFSFGTALELRWVAVGLVLISGGSALLMILRARPAYVEALRRALERRRFEQDDLVEDLVVNLDSETINFIQKAIFDEGDEGKAVFALHMLGGDRSPQVREILFRACRHPSALVRKEASSLIAELGMPTDAPQVADLIETEPDPTVVAAHLVTLATLGQEGRQGSVEGLLDDDRPAVRAAAVCCALRLGIASQGAEERFVLLSRAEDALVRQAMAGALTEFAHPALWPRCALLLEDEDLAVRTEAIRAAAAIRSPELLDALLACFLHRGPRDEAGNALAALGDAAVPALGQLAQDPETPLALRVRVPKLLASVDSLAAGKVLETMLSDPSEEVRLYAIRSLSKLTRAPGGYDHPPKALLMARIRSEVIHCHLLATLQRGLASGTDPQKQSLLYQELGHRGAQGLARVFGLTSMLEDPKLTAIVHWNLTSGDARLRANAIELIDTAFSREVAALEVPLVERRERTADLARIFPEAADALRGSITDPVGSVLLGPDPWLGQCAAVGWPDEAARKNPAVHREVQAMLPLIEKILFLQSVNIFKELSGEELRFIAGIAEETPVAAGQVLFQQGDPGDAMYLVLDGTVSIRVGGAEIVRLGKRECVGEMAVLDNLPRSADAVAVEQTELLKIDAQSFDELLQEKHQIVKGIFKVLSSRLRVSTARRATDPRMKVFTPPAEG
ncbi:MAG: Npt1/Npt2 family nucleotide transporter [Polyangia bacterium]|jgi:ATP/ADP translocase/HEAT repeat protein|nr:Npt1/Npt2 family nucleotide transporter [Polyangia bacterium]